jgi:hypothetical protein
MNTTVDKQSADPEVKKQSEVNECMQEFNHNDQFETETLNKKIHHVCMEFVRRAELFEINPNPIPHIYLPHEEIARYCFWAVWFFNVAGVFVTVWLTSPAVAWPVLGGIAATIVFFMAEIAVKLGVSAALPEKFFIKWFHVFYWPWLAVLLASVSIVWLERNASPDLAATLMNYGGVGWCGAEVSLAFLSGLAYVGKNRFGWSDEAVREVQTAESRISELTKRIARRTGKLLLALFVVLCVGTSARGECPLLLVDFSGSVARQDDSAYQLISNLAEHATEIPCVRIVFFSGRALSSSATAVNWGGSPSGHPPDPFLTLAEARKTKLRKDAKEALLKVMSFAARVPARCTSMLDVSARAVMDPGPVLILTDFVHDCAPFSVHLPKGSSDRIVVVISPSKRDRGSEYEVFLKRAAECRRLMPDSKVFAESQMSEAVVALVRFQLQALTVKTSASR